MYLKIIFNESIKNGMKKSAIVTISEKRIFFFHYRTFITQNCIQKIKQKKKNLRVPNGTKNKYQK